MTELLLDTKCCAELPSMLLCGASGWIFFISFPLFGVLFSGTWLLCFFPRSGCTLVGRGKDSQQGCRVGVWCPALPCTPVRGIPWDGHILVHHHHSPLLGSDLNPLKQPDHHLVRKTHPRVHGEASRWFISMKPASAGTGWGS